MQSFTTYEFQVDFKDSNSNAYIETKDTIERLYRDCELYAKLNNKDILVQYSKIKRNSYITCIVLNRKAQFGIYERKTPNTILQKVSEDYLEYITKDALLLLKNRAEITACNSQTIKVNPFQDVWLNYLKEKSLPKQIEEFEQ